MIEQLDKNLYRIGVPLPGNPLKWVNSYYIYGEDRELLIDTGFNREECREVLFGALKELGANRDNMDILLTHVHSDHSGMSAVTAGEKRKIFLSERDISVLDDVVTERHRTVMGARMVREGFAADSIARIIRTNPARLFSLQEIDPRITPIHDGDILTAGEYELKVIQTPGHSPGHTMFWCEKKGIMFTGDHILFDISPNIAASIDVEDALGDYLNSLRKVREYDVELALPGHRHSGDYKARIDQLLEHHRKRIAEAEKIVKESPGITAYDIAGKMTWKIRARNWDSFPEIQKWYAVGECLSHMDYLRKRGMVKRIEDGTVQKYVPM